MGSVWRGAVVRAVVALDARGRRGLGIRPVSRPLFHARTDAPAQAGRPWLRDGVERVVWRAVAAAIVHVHGRAPTAPWPDDVRNESGSGVPAICKLAKADPDLRAAV